MNRLVMSVVAMFAFAIAAHAHMVYVVPAKEGQAVTVVFSDSLDPDEKVKMTKVAGLKLIARVDGKDVPVECTQTDHSFSAKFTKAPTMAFGSVTYGLMTKSERPSLLVYHPKAVFAGANGKAATIGADAELEIVPVSEAGKTRFQLLAKGLPVANAEGNVMFPDGAKDKLTTDKDGYTTAFEKTGRIAVYLKRIETKSGEHEGKKYEEVRHYATLVVDVAK